MTDAFVSGHLAKHHPAALHPSAHQNRSERSKVRAYLPTLFDRLCDDEPSQSVESNADYTASRSRLREIVLRDLAQLLNTTECLTTIEAHLYPEAARSSINYGVAPLAGGYLSEKKWSDIENIIRTAIERFEPRLLKDTLVVRPLLKDVTSHHYNVLIFEISGHIQMSQYPIEFTVQSAVDLENSRIELRPR